MKKYIKSLIFLLLVLSGCQDDFINLKPLDQFTDAVYFNKPDDFKEFAGNFYGLLTGWDFANMDNSTDLSANTNSNGSDLGHGTISASGSNWSYSGIRNCNILLSKAREYSGNFEDISRFAGEAYFFRAFSYWNLLKTYGGVPIDTTVLDTNSPELFAPRNSRYQVVGLILADLDKAIANLPPEQLIPVTEKGRISKWAAEALKAYVELYEATWEKYVGQSTDGDGVTEGAGSEGYSAGNFQNYLRDAIRLTNDIIENGGYSLWNKNSDSKMENSSSWYLFNLEGPGSNPGGYDKSTNQEFILYSVYDNTLKQSGKNISWTSYQLYPSRKFVDLPVCTDGLPIDKSPLFEGYHEPQDEFAHRDLRLLNYLFASDEAPTSVNLDFGSLGYSGYNNNKFAVYEYGSRRTDGTESANWPIIRLADVYLIYAESLVELNGEISDADLDKSINRLRDRAGVGHLTNALATQYSLDLKEEIRRERAVELYREGKRFDDLKRWGILEESLNPSRLGRVVGGANYSTAFRDASGDATDNYKPNSYVWGEEAVQTPEGELNCVVVDSKQNHSVSKKHYLYPISTDQIALNKNLLQNPGY